MASLFCQECDGEGRNSLRSPFIIRFSRYIITPRIMLGEDVSERRLSISSYRIFDTLLGKFSTSREEAHY